MTDEKFVELITDPSFRIYGWSTKDILRFDKFMRCWMLTIDDLDNVGVRKYERQASFIKDAMFDDAWRIVR